MDCCTHYLIHHCHFLHPVTYPHPIDPRMHQPLGTMYPTTIYYHQYFIAISKLYMSIRLSATHATPCSSRHHPSPFPEYRYPPVSSEYLSTFTPAPSIFKKIPALYNLM